MSTLTVVAKIVAKQDSVDAVRSELLKIIAPTRMEAGCIAYNLYQDHDKPALFIFVENWKSAEALEAHMATAHFRALVAAIGGITDGITINKLTQLD